jgi:hypothetical protein
MVALAPLKAHAAEPLSLPMRFACMRMDPDGFAYISSQEQGLWRSFQSRLGGLISDIRPIQPANRLGLVAPKTDSGASCALAARALALEAGFDLVLLYGTLNGRRSYEAQGNVLSRLFASLRSEHGPYDPSTGEAHLLDAGGGAPLLSFRSDAPPKSLIDRVPGGREPELEALTILIDQFEQRLLDVARDAYRSERSIAD